MELNRIQIVGTYVDLRAHKFFFFSIGNYQTKINIHK